MVSVNISTGITMKQTKDKARAQSGGGGGDKTVRGGNESQRGFHYFGEKKMFLMKTYIYEYFFI